MSPSLDLTDEPARALVAAIAGRNAVRLTYAKDGASRQRVGHPHVLYRDAAGRPLVDVYQVAGYSSSGRLPQWRMFALEAVAHVEVLAERFEPAHGYNPDNPRFAHIVARVRVP